MRARLSGLIRYVAVAAVWVATASGPVTAADRGVINWLIWELSPEFIKSGEMAGRGFADKFLAHFIAELPDYDHAVHWTNVKRWHQEALLPGRCSPHLWGHFYPGELIYSKAYTLTPPTAVITHRRHRNRFGEPGSLVSLRALLQQRDLVLLTLPLFADGEDEQSRYPVLEPVLVPHRGQPNLQELHYGINEVDLRLLERGRADYALGYPTAIVAQQRDRGVGDDLIVYDIEEHRQFRTIHVACSDDAQGRQVVRRINEIITEPVLETFLGFHEEWNQGYPSFRDAFTQRFLKRGMEGDGADHPM